MLDFDEHRNWEPLLAEALNHLVSGIVVENLAKDTPEYLEDDLDAVLACTNRKLVLEVAVDWIRSSTVAGYHGTRLRKSEVYSIRAEGLMPLDANTRRHRLARVLSMHPNWDEVGDRLDSTLQEYGAGAKAGNREGWVDLTLSRSGLVEGFNHYLLYGSEFDQRVADALLGSEGKELLRRDGRARVFRLAVPGTAALNAANRYPSVEERLARGEIPNIVREFLAVWAYGQAHPEFDGKTQKFDCGMRFRKQLPPSWIVDFETLCI